MKTFRYSNSKWDSAATVGGFGIRTVGRASSSEICSSQAHRRQRHRGVKTASAGLVLARRKSFSFQLVWFLNILWRIPLSIFTAYGLTA